MLARQLTRLAGGWILVAAASAASAAAPCAMSPGESALYARAYPAPYAGPVNHAHAAPQFQWGWFGAQQFYPQVGWHRDYNGEVMRWSTKRRY